MVPDHTRGAHPTASGRLRTVVLFWQSYPALTNGGVVDAVVPCGLGGSSLATWVRDFSFEGTCRIRPELKELDDQQFFAIEGSCRSRPALEELDGQEFFAIEGS